MSTFRVINNKAYLEKYNIFKPTPLVMFFDGDIINDGKCIYSPIKNRSLIGIINTSKKYKSEKDKDFYIIKPLDRKLPNFIISFKNRNKLRGNIIIKFKFLKWKSKLPYGMIEEVIGKKEENNLIKSLLEHYRIYPKSFSYKYELNPLENKINRINLTHLEIISIDPSRNCPDIDDALSIIKDDKHYIIGVHIANPVILLNEKIINKVLDKKFSTLYYDNTQKNLWGDAITKNTSLKEGKERYAFSVLFKINIERKVIEETFFKPSKIIVKKNLSYDDNHNILSKLISVTSSFDSNVKDSHDLVNYWMIKTNHAIGRKIINTGLPYRVIDIKNKLDIDVPEEIKTTFKNRHSESAKYSIDSIEHGVLKLNNYTHFTSPIRRIIDTIIHYYLTYNIKINFDINHLNFLDSQTKKFHKEMDLKSKIENLEDITITDGYLFQIIKPNIWEIYIKNLGFVKMELFNSKFEYKFEFYEENNEYIVKNDLNKFTFKIGKKMKVKIMRTYEYFPKESFKVIPDELILNI